MKTFRLSIAFLLLALVFAIVPATFAQDETFGLSDADYQTFVAANTNVSTYQSAAFDVSLSFAVSGVEGSDVSANLSGSGVFSVADQTFSLALSGTVAQGAESQDISAEVRVVDGIIYVNDGSGWQGSPLDDAVSSFGDGFAEGAGVEADDLASGDLSALGLDGLDTSALENLNPADFISIVRTADGASSVYTVDFDLGALLSSPAVAPLLAGAMMGEAGDMTDAQIQQVGAMMGMMFGTSSISFSEYVNSSSQINRAVFDVSLPLDAMLGAGAGITLNLDLSLSGINEPVTVTAPEGAVMSSGS